MDYATYTPRIMTGTATKPVNVEGRKNLQRNLRFIKENRVDVWLDEESRQIMADIVPRGGKANK